MLSLTRSNLLRQLSDLNEIIRRLTANCYRNRFNRNIFMTFAIIIVTDARSPVHCMGKIPTREIFPEKMMLLPMDKTDQFDKK
jgi:hypothetical protein